MNAHLSSKTGDSAPDLIRLVVYGILGGLAGKPVSITFRDWPKDLLASFWGHLTSSFPDEQIAEVWSQSDVQKLKSTIHSIRVVLRYPSNGRGTSTEVVDWMIEKRRATGESLPTVFSAYHAMSNEAPGPTLLARCTPLLCRDLTTWLNAHSIRPLLLTATEDPLPRITGDHLIDAIRLAKPDDQPLSLRNTKIIEGLVVGVLLASPRELLRRDTEPIEATPAQYSIVRELLQSPCLQTIHEPHDGLTLAMIKRANLFMSQESTAPTKVPLGARTGNTSTVKKGTNKTEMTKSITRSQLVDLGNPQSGTLHVLAHDAAGKQDTGVLKSLGFPSDFIKQCRARSPPKQRVDELLKSIEQWSYKQVRTRFDRLQRDGLVEVNREVNNGPLKYILPKELVDLKSPFIDLPTVKDVEQHF